MNAQPHNPAPRRVLIVDDDFSIRGMFSKAFELQSIDVDVAEDGVQAMRLLTLYPERYCAVLLDLNIPGPDGIRIAQHVQQELPELPIVMVTGDDDCRERVRNAGLDGTVRLIVRKPADPSAVAGYVQTECFKRLGS